MKRLISLVCVAVLFSGCVAYDATKIGVTDFYNGGKTVLVDGASGLGKIFLGKKSVKVSVEVGEPKESDNGEGSINE